MASVRWSQRYGADVIKPRESALDTLRLVTAMLRRIPRVGATTAQRLQEQLAAEGLHRDVRTIQRQLESLSSDPELGLERDDRSKPYGYRWAKGAKGFSVMSLTPQDALLLRLAEQQLKHLLPARLMKSMDGIFKQAHRQLIDQSDPQREKEWLSKVRAVATSQPMLPPKIDPHVFEEVSNALYGNLWMDVEYKGKFGKKTQGRVMPLGLVQQGHRLYLVCRFEGFDNERCLALHRLLLAKASTLSFERPADFSLQKAEEDGLFGWGRGKPVHLVFWASNGLAVILQESPLSADQTLEKMDGGYRVTANVIDSLLLRQWLRSHGDDVRVIELAESSSSSHGDS